MNHVQPVPVRDHKNFAEMHAAHVEIHARLWPAPPRAPVPAKPAAPLPAKPEVPVPASPADVIQSRCPARRLDNFAIYDGSRVAHAAMLLAASSISRAAINQPPAINPIFIHGAVGLGKTHLLQGAVAEAQAAGVPALYLSAEAFLNGSHGSLPLRYRLIAIDDVQLISGKREHAALRRAIDEVLSTCRQIVLAAALAPDVLEYDAQLGSRINAGLIESIGAPDCNARAVILRSLLATIECGCGTFAAAVTDDIITAIANAGPASGRCLSGILHRMLADHLYSGLAPTVERALHAAADKMRRPQGRKITIEEIQRAVAQHYHVSRNDILSERRTSSVVRPRQVAMYLAKTMTPRSLPEIGRRFGGKDHTTVLHAVRKMEALVNSDQDRAPDQELAATIAAIRQKLGDGMVE
jgi:chromosomal replication initiator protein